MVAPVDYPAEVLVGSLPQGVLENLPLRESLRYLSLLKLQTAVLRNHIIRLQSQERVEISEDVYPDWT